MTYQLILSALLLLNACTTQKKGNDIIYSAVPQTSKYDQDSDTTFPVAEYTTKHNLDKYSQAIFAGGCFWCTEAAFERINGVVDVISGYSGGHQAHPSYKEVGGGTTGHTEAIYIYYDSEIISYDRLLDVLFVAHDPTTLNSQGPDFGEEYRSAIYYKTSDEQKIIDTKIKKLNASGQFQDKIVTEVAPYKQFWVAENYHQNYYELHPGHGYVTRVSRPKVNKVMNAFPELIKLDFRKR